MKIAVKNKENNLDKNGEITAFDMVNRYGTYNIQKTADTENMYPTVAQGFNKGIVKTDCVGKRHGKGKNRR